MENTGDGNRELRKAKAFDNPREPFADGIAKVFWALIFMRNGHPDTAYFLWFVDKRTIRPRENIEKGVATRGDGVDRDINLLIKMIQGFALVGNVDRDFGTTDIGLFKGRSGWRTECAVKSRGRFTRLHSDKLFQKFAIEKSRFESFFSG
jgi:hypothetical protein